MFISLQKHLRVFIARCRSRLLSRRSAESCCLDLCSCDVPDIYIQGNDSWILPVTWLAIDEVC